MIGQGLKLSDLAQNILDGVVEHWARATDAEPLPARRAVLAGDPRTIAWDCEQLTVTLAGIGWGQALDASAASPRAGLPASVSSMRHAVLAVTLVRCTPTPGRDGRTPPVAKLHDVGLSFMRDAGLLSQALVEITSRLRKGLPMESSVQAGAVEPIGPNTHHGLGATLVVTTAELE